VFAVVTCLQEHDLRLVGWAAAICLVAVAAGLGAYRRAISTRGVHRLAWVAIVALLLGSGVWATHFMAMLAYQRDLRIGFVFDLTATSLVASILGMGGGVAIASGAPDRSRRLIGGAVCGGAIALMHFVGVAGMRLPAEIVWDPSLVAVAIAIAIVGAAAAFAAARSLSRPGHWIAGALLLVAAIFGLHFTAMSAVTLIPTLAQVDTGLYGRHELAYGVAGLAGLIVLAAAALLGIDRIGALTALNGLRAALNYAPSAMALFDCDARLMVWNEAYAELHGTYGVPIARGQSFQGEVALAAGLGQEPPGPEFTPEALIAADTLDTFAAPDGRWFQPQIGPTHDGGFAVLLTDITEQLAQTNREVAARQAAEAANRAKSEFLANMSHEIRTPLNGVLGMTQIMRRDTLSTAQRQRLDIIADAGHALLSVLDGLLDISKIEAGKVELEIHPFDLEATMKVATAAVAPLAAQKDIRFDVDLDPQALGAWSGDSTKLRQILANLLSNALKFTSQGRIGLQVRAVPTGLAFEVSDTGLGIPAHKQAMIFEKFTQADASTTRRYGGTGLGLAICREYVALMGGQLRLASEEGVGSVFSFSIPMSRESHPLAGEGPNTSGSLEDLDAPLRVLAAEDNPINQLILKALLEPLGVEMTMTANGREAVDACVEGRFDVILMDAQMPELNGVDAARRIREHEVARGRPRTPIIALTANVMRHQIDTYEAAGMDGFVAKPIEVASLMIAIETALAQAGQGGARDVPSEVMPAAE
jgi:signal transduction histidine kinase